MNRIGSSLWRIGWIAHHTLREAARQKVASFFLLLAVGLVAAAWWLRDLSFGAPEPAFIAECGFGAMAFFGSAWVILATTQLFFGELERRTVLTLLARPVSRAEFVLGKFAGVVALAGVFCLVVAVAMGAVLAIGAEAPTPRGVNFAGLAVATLLQWLELSVLAAFTLLVASYARTQLFAAGCAFLVLAICHLQHLAHGAYARAESVWTRGLAAVWSWVFPNFQVFAAADAVLESRAGGEIMRVMGYAGIYVVAAVVLAVVSFRRREL